MHNSVLHFARFCSFVSLFVFDMWFIQWNWMANATIKLWSKYFLDLPPGSEVKKRYEEIMSLAGFSEDPYCCLEMKGKGSSAVVSVEWTNWPDISWADIYNYLILMPGVTHEQLKAYKSLEGYNF